MRKVVAQEAASPSGGWPITFSDNFSVGMGAAGAALDGAGKWPEPGLKEGACGSNTPRGDRIRWWSPALGLSFM